MISTIFSTIYTSFLVVLARLDSHMIDTILNDFRFYSHMMELTRMDDVGLWPQRSPVQVRSPTQKIIYNIRHL